MIPAGLWGARVAYKSKGLILVGLVTDQGPIEGTVKVEWETAEGVRSAYLPARDLILIAKSYSHLPPPRKTA